MSSTEFDPEEPVVTDALDPEEYDPTPAPRGFETDEVDHADQVAEIELDEPEA